MIKQLHLFAFICLILSACNQCKDKCVNGVCIEKYCDCDVWYEGDKCDRSELSIYEGEYKGVFSFGTETEAVSFNLTSSSETPSILYSAANDLKFEFTTITRFNFPAQNWMGEIWMGEGEMLLDLMSIRLQYTDSAGIQHGLIEAYRAD